MDDGRIKDSRIRMDFLLSPGKRYYQQSLRVLFASEYGDAQRKDAGNGL